MRTHLTAFLGITIMATVMGGCAAASADDGLGSSEGAVSASSRLDDGEVAALRSGIGLTCRQDAEENATLCAHERGVIVLTDDGIALLEASDGVVTAKALAKDTAEKDDVGAVLDPIANASGDSNAQSIRPQGLASKMILDGIAALLERATARTAAKAADREAQVVAARSAEKAGDLTELAKQLRSGEAIARSGSQTILAGSSTSATVANAKRWLLATGRRTIGVPGIAGAYSGPDEIARFYQFMATEKARLAPGERLTIVMSPAHGSRVEFAQAAHAAGIDFVWIGGGIQDVGDAVVQVPADVMDNDLIKAISERLYSADSDAVGPL